jgi:hypothetical protein
MPNNEAVDYYEGADEKCPHYLCNNRHRKLRAKHMLGKYNMTEDAR